MLRRHGHAFFCHKSVFRQRRYATQEWRLILVLTYGIEVVLYHFAQCSILSNISNTMFLQLTLKVCQLIIALGTSAWAVALVGTLCGGVFQTIFLCYISADGFQYFTLFFSLVHIINIILLVSSGNPFHIITFHDVGKAQGS